MSIQGVSAVKKANVQLDPAFVEEAVFLNAKAHENDALAKSFHRDREKIYSDLDEEHRFAAFRHLYEEYFVRMGLREIFEKILLEFPLLCQPNLLIFVKRVWSKKEEESELYVQGDRMSVYLGLQAIRILDPIFLNAFLCHEMMHISDMLDPDFRYTPHPDFGGEDEIKNNLIKERFRILWNLYVEARLKRRDLPTFSSEEKYKKDFEKVFCEMSSGKRFTQGDLLCLVKGEPIEDTFSRRDFLKKVPAYFAGNIQTVADGYIKLLGEEKGVKVAALDIEKCLAWEGVSCQHCYLACPLREKAIHLEDQKPVILSSFCNGCAECVVACQTVNDLPALKMIPVTV